MNKMNKQNKRIPTLTKALQIKLQEHFIIQSQSSSQWYLQDVSPAGTELWGESINQAIKFQSINTAIQFNRIAEGRIQSVFN